MKFHLVILCLFPVFLGAQTTISGLVTDQQNRPLGYANVYLKDVFDGGSADENGQFSFTTQTTGTAVLIVSSIGYETVEKTIALNKPTLEINVQLKASGNELSEIIVSAGAFEASDEKKGTILKPLDIVTNPAASADLYGALQTLPGVTPVGEETGLFVRGGEASETKTIIDGSLVARPFFGDVPDIPARGRFDPFLFKGTLFSTGGYSAEYGQALSSVLILNTQDLPSNSEYSLSLNMAGVGGSITQVWKEKTAFLANVNYTNLNPLFSIVPQNRDWVKPPNGVGGALGFRHKTDNGGMYKSYLQYQNGNISLNFTNNSSQNQATNFQNNNQNLFWNHSYSGLIGKKSSLFAAASISYDDDQDQLGSDEFGSKELLTQGRITVSREFGKVYTRIGSEVQYAHGEYYFNEFSSEINNPFTAFYLESDIRLGKRLAGRIGVRSEYAGVIEDFNVMPRVSLTYKPGASSLFSLAYGQFFQTPEPDFLRQSQNLNFEQSTHYILNYQWQTEQRIFRIEAYYKDYDNLIKLEDNDLLNNAGFGHSKGIDLFWRDQQTIPNLTYWVSYSLIDADRFYRDFPNAATPTFVSNHTLSIIGNYNITPRIRVGGAYSFASGRPYFNPNNPDFLSDKIIDYHNVNFSSSYLTSLWDNFTVIYFSLRNPFGIKQVFGYNYSEDGSTRAPILPASTWSFFTGISVSFRK